MSPPMCLMGNLNLSPLPRPGYCPTFDWEALVETALRRFETAEQQDYGGLYTPQIE